MTLPRLSVLAIAAVLSACGVMPKPETPTVLRLAPRFDIVAPPGGAVTVVTPVLARGVAADRRYAYVDRGAPGEVRQAATLFWEEPPPKAVERALVEGLRATLGAAVGPGASADAAQRVSARLERFEEVTGGGAGAEAAVALDVTVVGAARDARLAGRYCAQAPIAADTPTDRARAFEAALSAAVLALAHDLRSGAARPSRSC